MVTLKANAFEHRVWWVKNDIKRILFFIGLPILSMLPFSFINWSFLGLNTTNLSHQTLLGILFGIFSFIICFFIQLYSPNKPDYRQELRATLFFSSYLLLVNAFAEEFFFRGFIQSLLSQIIHDPILLIILSALIFGIYHIPMFKWSREKAFVAFLGGLLFGVLFYYTRSLLVVWLAHGLGDLGLIHEAVAGYFIWTKIRHKELAEKVT